MNSNGFVQLSLNFSVIKSGTKVRIDGYDCHQLLDLTNCIGVVYLYSQSTGDYLIYFPKKKGIVPDTKLIRAISAPAIRNCSGAQKIGSRQSAIGSRSGSTVSS